MPTTSSSATPSPFLPASVPSSSSQAGAGPVPTGPGLPRRAGGDVALGLFSKIAAARKDKLSAIARASVGDAITTTPNYEKRGSLPATQPSSHFPEIADNMDGYVEVNSGRGTAARPLALHPRKVTAQNFAQNLRWAKQPATMDESFTSGRHRSVSVIQQRGVDSVGIGVSGPATPVNRAPRRSIDGLRAVNSVKSDRHLLLKEYNSQRPSTANEVVVPSNEDPTFGSVRGYVRRMPESSVISTDVTNPVSPKRIDRLELVRPRTMESQVLDKDSKRITVRKALPQAQQETPLPDTSDLNATPGGESGQQEWVKDKVFFAVTAEIPGVPIIYRNQKAKASNPERLNLDRRNLPVVPLLEGEQVLRLLNLQNNAIRKIENLFGLPNLIFLDLYNNRIEKLEGLDVVPNLRVLMMGKNRLRAIENLECLKKLDVLDLHSNEIEQMQNLNELRELRVLNLGGNKITVLENVEKLTLLNELNLRRNAITRIGIIGNLPSLQRLFLSNNKLETLEAIEPLFQISSINELRLDSNAVCESNQAKYRARMIQSFPGLRHLDLRALSDSDRQEATQYFASPPLNSSTQEQDEAEEAQRTHTVSCIRGLWNKRDSLGSFSGRGKPRSQDNSWGGSGYDSASTDLPCSAGYEERELKPTMREDPTIHNNNTGFSIIEVHGDFRVLIIYGDALAALESTRARSIVNAITFRFIDIEKVASDVMVAHLKLFTRLRRLNFSHNDLNAFAQLTWLSFLGTKAEEVYISHNGVCGKALLKRFVGARLSNVVRLNSEEISLADRILGKQLFPKASKGAQVGDGTDSLESQSHQQRPEKLKEKDRLSISKSVRPLGSSGNAALATVSVAEIFSLASDMETKASVLDHAWKALLASIIQETLQDMEKRESVMSSCLDGL